MDSYDKGFEATQHEDATIALPQSPSKFSSVFLQRVTKSFPTISLFSDKAKNIYNSVKELNPTLKNGLETAENKLDEKVSVYHDVLVKVDTFGVRQLDKVEELVQSKPLETLKSVNKEKVLTCVNEKIVAPASNAISQRIVTPASSMISEKINKALTITERTVDNYVSLERSEDEAKNQELRAATRVKNITSKVSKHVKNRVLTNLQHATIRLRPQEKVEELKAHSVDLIKYFNENIASQPKNFVATVQKKSAEKKEAIVTNSRKALDSAKTKATDVKKQVTARISKEYLAISQLVFANSHVIRLSERLSPYLLYASAFIPSLNVEYPTPQDQAETNHSNALASVEEKLHHIELKVNKHDDGSSSYEIFVPLPSYSQVRLLLSQQTLKLAVERMLELIAKTQHKFAPVTKSNAVEVADE